MEQTPKGEGRWGRHAEALRGLGEAVETENRAREERLRRGEIGALDALYLSANPDAARRLAAETGNDAYLRFLPEENAEEGA